MLKIGITGGIGAGKTAVSKLFIERGFPVFFSDDEAKNLMHQDPVVRQKIKDIFGNKAYTKDGLNRKFIADKIFTNNELKEKINQIIHPAVREAFSKWADEQSSEIVFNEAAILFETGSYTQFDYTILVTAPIETRIERVIKRDNTTEQEIRNRMDNQWTDEEKTILASFVINNDKDLAHTEEQVDAVLEELMKL